jgi:methylmalonyl-CoA decarboxylase
MSDEPSLIVERRDAVLLLTINRPRVRNALDAKVSHEIAAALDELDADAGLRVGVLTGAGGTFSSGMDLKAFGAGERPVVEGRGLAGFAQKPPRKPLIAAVEGYALAGGFEVVLACDLIVATASATFALTPAKLGVPYNISGMLTFLHAANIRIVKEMAFTAQPIEAARAERLGMINYVVPAAELEAFTMGLARQISANAPLSIAVMKEQLRILGGAHPMSPQGFERVQGLRRIVYDSHDYQEGIRAFKEKRKPVFKGE